MIRWLASRQYNAVSRRQLRSAGLSDRQIDVRLARGSVVPVHRGVFVLTATPIDATTRFAAALLASGPDAALSHRSAAHLHGMLRADRGPTHVVTRFRSRARPGIVGHRSTSLDHAVTVRARLPCTTVARTLMDLAGTHGPAPFLRAWTTLAGRRALDVKSVQREVLLNPNRPGTATVRLQLAEHRQTVSGIARTNLEAQAIAFCGSHGLPMPAVNGLVEVEGRIYEADLSWPRERVIVEIDTWQTHGHATSFREDRQRDFALQRAGWATVRLLEPDLTTNAAETASRLSQLLANRR
jgi:hypothetical protein